tara:strand:- start:1599 stop:1796 length:198 start_codon:yes stop_codon:yes gene_type:complete
MKTGKLSMELMINPVSKPFADSQMISRMKPDKILAASKIRAFSLMISTIPKTILTTKVLRNSSGI